MIQDLSQSVEMLNRVQHDKVGKSRSVEADEKADAVDGAEAVEAVEARDWPVPEGLELRVVRTFPMDARHASKVNLTALEAALR